MKILLIIPCYNEAKRLKKDNFASSGIDSIDILFVDDCSTDNTKEILREISLELSNVDVISTDRRLGKGNAIRFAVNLARKKWLHNYSFVAYMDADGSTGILEIALLRNYLMNNTGHDTCFGSRVHSDSFNIARGKLRSFYSKIFNQVIRSFLDVDISDTQCPAKIFRTSLVEDLFKDSFLNSWLFDIELYLRSDRSRVVERPINNWREVGGGTFKPITMLPNIILGLLRIKLIYKR